MKKNIHHSFCLFFQTTKPGDKKRILMKLYKQLFPFFLILILLLFGNKSFSQVLTGTKYITSYNSHTANYNTIAAAIADLNSKGVGAGGVIFMIPPGYTETFTNATVVAGTGVPTGYTITGGGVSITTATGTAANTIAFLKDNYTGGADPLITAGVGAGSTDAILTITGGHYITFNGIDLVDPTSNASGNADMEYGYYVKNSSATNGATNNIITNCKITLQRINPNTSAYGIYQNVATAPTSSAGANSNNTYSNDTVTNVYNGIYLLGNATNPDVSCVISGCAVGSTTSNDIGGSAGTAVNFGIQVTNQSGVIIHNTEVKNVTNASGSSPYGIEVTTPVGTSSVYACKVHEVTDLKNSTSCAVYGVYINDASGNTVNVYNNFIYDIFYGHGASTSTKNQFLLYTTGTGAVNIYFNSILSNTTMSEPADIWTTCLYVAGNTVNVVDNIFKVNIRDSTNADNYCIYIASGTLSTTSNYNNYDITDPSGKNRNCVGYNGANEVTLANWLSAVTSPTDANSSDFSTSFTNTTVGSVDLHLAVFIPTPAYSGIMITTPSITTDIDGDTRIYPMIGADEVNFTTPSVLVGGGTQPSDSSVSKGSTENVLYGITFTVYNASTVFSGITVNTNTSANNNYAVSNSTDFSKFQFWIDSVNSSFNPTTAMQLGSTITNAPAYSGSLTFSPTLVLSSGKTYYLFITDSVGALGTQGDNINLVTTSLTNITFSSGTTKTGSTGAGGKQTIVQDWYNWGDTWGVGDPRQDASSLLGWYDSTTHASTPSDFVTNNQRFNVIRYNSTMLNSLTLGQTGTTNLHFVIGTGAYALGFWATQPITTVGAAVVDVENLDTLRLLTSSTPTALGTLATGSTVEYGDTAIATTQTIIAAKYYNLKLSNLSGGGTRTFPGWVGVAGTFTPGNYFTTASNGTISFDGTTAQTIPAFTYNNLTVNNSSATATSILSGTVHINSLVTDSTAFTVPTADTLVLNTSATVASLIGTTTINGTLSNNDPLKTTFAGTATSTLLFGANSNYNLIANLTTASNNNGQIPAATWASNSTINITGITNATTAITVGAPTAAGFGNISFDDTAMTSAGSYKLFGGFTSPVTFQGTITLGRINYSNTNGIQMYTGAMTVNAANVVINSSSYGLMSYANTGILNVSGNFTVNGTNPYSTSTGYTSPNFVIASLSGANGTLNVGGTFLMTGSSTLSQTAGTAALNFTGTTAQNATFTAVSSSGAGPLNMGVTTSTNVVTLLSNLNLPGSSSILSLTGKLAINGNTLTLNGIYSSAGTSGTLTGSSSSNLVIGSRATSVPLTFTYDASRNKNSLLSLTVNANTSLANSSTTSSLYIAGGTSTNAGSVTVVGSSPVFTTNDSLTLESTATGTAYIGANSLSGSYISGKVAIERYFPAHRAWRLVTAPIVSSSTLTINQAWQDSVSNSSRLTPINPDPGYGTEITRSTTYNATTQFDQGSTNNPSIAYYTGSGWAVPTGTNIPITSYPGYMLFVRGDRSLVVAGTNVTPVTTVLHPKGQLNMGTQPTFGGTGMTVFGNPYASTIYYDGIMGRGTNLSTYYYEWDPLMTGTNSVGSFIAVKYLSAHSYYLVPDPRYITDSINATPHPVDTTGAIQSGQGIICFFASGASPAAGTSYVKETDKTIASDDYVFRPASPLADTTELFRTNLFAVNSDGTTSLEDGGLDLYNDTYSNSLDFQEDAPKLNNIYETIALSRNGYNLAIDSRKIIGITDTVFYSISNMQQKQYVLQLIATGLNHPGLSGFLIDSFLHTRTPISLNGTTDVPFTITSDAASSAVNRFMVVFVPIAAGSLPLPVTFTGVKAWQQSSSNIAVQWNVENQLNIKEYEVEKSIDGRSFSIVSTIAATSNKQTSVTYNWEDNNAIQGANYYRIIGVGDNGSLSYSQVVKVEIGAANPFTAVYPNPVQDGVIGLQFTNMPAGKYVIRLIDNIGQVIQSDEIEHAIGSSSGQIKFNNTMAKGVYHLEVTGPGNYENDIKVLN